MQSNTIERKAIPTLTVFFMLVLFLGLASYTIGNLEQRYGANLLSAKFNQTWIGISGGWYPGGFASGALVISLAFFTIGALGLVIPLRLGLIVLRRKLESEGFTSLDELRKWLNSNQNTVPQPATYDELSALRSELEMNIRLRVLQWYLGLSTGLGWVYIKSLALTATVRLSLSIANVYLLKRLKLLPAECHLLSEFDPRVMWKVALQRYKSGEETAAMSAALGIGLLGVAYALLRYELISAAFLPLGSAYLAFFSWLGYRVTKAWLLKAWFILNAAGYTFVGALNMALIYGWLDFVLEPILS